MARYLPKIAFDSAEGRYKLPDRDWIANPPSVSETEHRYASLGLATWLLRDFCRQFAEGRIVVADGLSEVEAADTNRFLETVAEVMQAASTGASE